MSILLLPLLNISDKILEDLKREVGIAFVSKVDIDDPLISLPDDTYNKQAEKYDTAKLIPYLESLPYFEEDKILAVGNMDIFLDGVDNIFGTSRTSGKLSLLSLYRLDQRFYDKSSDYEKLKKRAIKEAIHGLGHCYGLGHCRDSKCVMVSSDNITSVDKKDKFFCEDCREKLRKEL
jgi:archaemetzincin